MASSRILSLVLYLQAAAPFLILVFGRGYLPLWIYPLISGGFFALAVGVWHEKPWASRLSMWVMALQIVHVSYGPFAFRVFFGWAVGVFHLPDRAPWYDGVGIYRSVGASIEWSLSHGSPSLQAAFKEEGPILALNLLAGVLFVAFLKHLEWLEEALERKQVKAAGQPGAQ